MSQKRTALGKGLKALLDDVRAEAAGEESLYEAPEGGQVASIRLEQIEVNPFQPRADFDQEKLRELAGSVKVHGLVQPVTVRRLDNKKYQLIAGERRLRAAKMAGLAEVPAFVRQANDQEMLEIGLIENIQREDLNAIEIAINYKRLLDECSLSQEKLAERVGKDRTTVTNYLRLLKLPPEIQLGLKEGKISMGHARAIINVEHADAQLWMYKQIVQTQLSVRQAEQLAQGARQKLPKEQKHTSPDVSLAYRKVQDRLTSRLETKVSLRNVKKGKGEIVIPFYSDEDLNRLLDLIGG